MEMRQQPLPRGVAFFAEQEHRDALADLLAEAGIESADLLATGKVSVQRLPVGVVVVASESFLRQASNEELEQRLRRISPAAPAQVVIVDAVDTETTWGLAETEVFACLPPGAGPRTVTRTVARAVQQTTVLLRNQQLERDLQKLNQIGVALSAERDLNRLLEMILLESRAITSADAGSLYIVERPEDEEAPAQLRFRLSQNDSLNLDYNEFVIPLSEESMAGYVGLSGKPLRIDDCYHLPPDAPYKFNKSFDEEHGYRSRSMLVVPMKNINGEVLGVIQCINRKRNVYAKLTSPEDVEREVVPFTSYSEDLVSSLASQAAVALENSRLYEARERLMEGFVSASVLAVEQRDPTTAGHSHRVATLTVALAERVNDDRYAWRDVHFDGEQLKELRYAGLLHDFGKIGVREAVLVKAKKLYDERLELVRERFDFAKRTLEAEISRRKIEYATTLPEEEYRRRFRELDARFEQELARLNEYYNTILIANEPSILRKEAAHRLVDIACATYLNLAGRPEPLLEESEVQALSIPKGSLTDEERREIESHVTHTFEFLRQIPWTRELRNVPEIAYAHHEKLDGSGYPRGVRGDAIPLQSKMMAIADIFDALTASDRPYKPAAPVERALAILEHEVQNNHLDPELCRLFREARVYELVL